MKWEKDWKQAFEDLKRDSYDGNMFGPNCWYKDENVIKYLSKLEKLGAKVELNVDFWESVKVNLPKQKGKCIDVLLYILTTSPSPTEVLRGKGCLELTWS